MNETIANPSFRSEHLGTIDRQSIPLSDSAIKTAERLLEMRDELVLQVVLNSD